MNVINSFIEHVENELSESVIWNYIVSNDLSDNEKSDKIMEYFLSTLNSVASRSIERDELEAVSLCRAAFNGKCSESQHSSCTLKGKCDLAKKIEEQEKANAI